MSGAGVNAPARKANLGLFLVCPSPRTPNLFAGHLAQKMGSNIETNTYSLHLDHNSPLFNYYPFADPWAVPDLTTGWAPWNSVSGGYDPSLPVPTSLDQGRWCQRTQQDGAQLELYFTGSSVILYGEVERTNYDIWIDGKLSAGTANNGRLADVDLDEGEHRLLLTAHPQFNGSAWGNIWFYGADIGVRLPDSPIVQEASTQVQFGSTWNAISDPVLGKYHATTASGASISVSLHQASAVMVYGIRNLASGRYNVTLDGNTNTFISKASFPSQSLLFAALDLDFTKDHNLTITNVDGSTLGISSVNVTTATPRPVNITKGGVPKGTVIALITAVSVVLLMLVVATVCAFTRRKLRAKRRARQRFQFIGPTKYQPFTRDPSLKFDDAVTVKTARSPSMVIIGDPRHSYEPTVQLDSDGEDDDGSYYFVQRPLLGNSSTPSLDLTLGSEFHVEFPSGSDASRHPSRASKKPSSHGSRSTRHQRQGSSEQTNFLHVQGSTHSSDENFKRSGSKSSSESGKHQSRIRFSLPANMPPPPLRTATSPGRPMRKSYQRSSRSTGVVGEPVSPAESLPFTVGTSVAFEHPDSTGRPSEESIPFSSEGTFAQHVRDPSESFSRVYHDSPGLIPASASQLHDS